MSSGRVARWWALPVSERWIATSAQAALPAIDLMLWLVGYIRLRRALDFLSPLAKPRAADADDLHRADRLAQLVSVVGQEGLVGVSCLRQALLVYLLLRRRGLAPDIRFGVRQGSLAVEAHAWVEVDGHEIGAGSMQHLPMASR